MPAFGDLKAQIANDLRRSNLPTEIHQAVLDAIRDHETERFYFNQTLDDETISLTAGTARYVVPVDFIKIDCIQMAPVPYTGTAWNVEQITQEKFHSLELIASSGQPTYWYYFNDRIEFIPTPASAYTAWISGHYRLPPLSSDIDNNAWTNAGKNLIRYSALKRLFTFPIRDLQQVQIAEGAEAKELDYLRRETDRRTRTGVMKAYYG